MGVMMVKSTKKKRSHIGLIIFTILLVILLGILGVNYKRFASKQLNPVRDNKVVKKDSPKITKTEKVVNMGGIIKKAMEELKLKKNSFYKLVHQYEE